MEEKKLTDEQIIMAYKYCVIDNVDCKNCPCDNWGCGIDRKDIFGLINRQKEEIEILKDEKQKVIQDYYAESQHCDQQKDIIAKQKAEIERLTKWKDKLQDAKDELEQQLIDTGFKEYCKENKRLEKENAELQKQVDVLTAEKENLYFLNKNLEDYIDNHEPIWKRNTERAVKDTAKEIYDYIKSIEEHGLPSSCVGEWIKSRLKDRYGVEVE
jgi:chromosome segregation ATPase